MKRVVLPQYCSLGKFNLKVDKYTDEYFSQVYELFQRSMTDSAGVGQEEFNSTEHLRELMETSEVKLVVHDRDAKDMIVSFFMLYPTPLSRSVIPLYAAAYGVVHKAYRGHGIRQHVFEILMQMSLEHGCPAVLSRTAITARATAPSLRAGSQLLGTIPRSLHVPQFGWIDDLINWTDYSFRMTCDEINLLARRKRVILTLPEYSGAKSTMKAGEMGVKRMEINDSKETLIFRGPNKRELYEVEEMVRHCAQTGDGFNLDEFCSYDGHFLHKFIHEPKVVIATDVNGTIQGAAIYGFSTLSRVPGSLHSAYFIVKEKARRKGIATKLLHVVTEICKQNNCKTMLVDVYVNNPAAIAWLTKEGFLATGCLPHCGYIANRGFTHSLLMSKRIDTLNAPDLLSKI